MYPDYYVVVNLLMLSHKKIKKPIALDVISNRIDSNKDYNLDEFEEDLKLMVANAIQYNSESSDVVVDARAILVRSFFFENSLQKARLL